jgi:hypothetical protein
MRAEASLTSHLSSRPLIAPVWHTIVSIAIFVGLSDVGGFFQRAVKQYPPGAVPSGNARINGQCQIRSGYSLSGGRA